MPWLLGKSGPSLFISFTYLNEIIGLRVSNSDARCQLCPSPSCPAFNSRPEIVIDLLIRFLREYAKYIEGKLCFDRSYLSKVASSKLFRTLCA